ncbi:MAG: hypothetical protein Aurels2KO_40980 [Aureliella sp.]
MALGIRMTTRTLFFIVAVLATPSFTVADFEPGDVFREYKYTNTYGDAGGSVRVGGKVGVSYPDRGSDHGYINTPIDLGHDLDLEHAIAAEVVVEKILSHNATTGLAIQFNDEQWTELPPPGAIPKPRADYYHHTCIVAEIPLSSLRKGMANSFRLRVSPSQAWNWPQHLVYGVHLRVYYDASKKPHATGTVLLDNNDHIIGQRGRLRVQIESAPRRVDRIDFLGEYENVNWAGDGVYRRWQYFYYRSKFIHHIGSSVTPPWEVTWNTEWIPDQEKPMRIAARIIDDAGLITITKAVDNVRLVRPNLSVELCKPIDTPDNWVTRNDAYQQPLVVKGDVETITAARLCWSSWSPGYMNGVKLNDSLVVNQEGPKYRYYDHRVPITDLSAIKRGRNIVSTGKTPRYDGKMVHGMEVNWPGIQMLIQRRTDP